MSNEINMTLGNNIQKEIVSLAIREHHFASKLISIILTDKDLNNLATKLFNSPLHNEIIRALKTLFLESDGLMPTFGIFEQHILAKDLDKKFKKQVIDEYERLYKEDYTLNPLHTKALIEIVTMAKTTVFTNKLVNELMSPSKSFLMGLHNQCRELANYIENLNFNDTGSVDMTDWFAIISENAGSSASNISFGIPEICNELNGGGDSGGIARKEVSALIAGTNDGKTIITTSMACDAIRDGHNVMIFGLEGKKLQTPLRILSNLSGVEFKRLSRYKDYVAKNDDASIKKYFTIEEVEKIKSGEKLFAEKIRFNHAIQNSEIESITTETRKAHREKRVDLLVVDYGQLVESLKTFKREDLLIGYVFRELEKLSAEINCATLVPMQVNRDGLNAIEAEFQAGEQYPSYRMGHVAGGYSSLKTCGTVFAMTRTKEERRNGQYRIKLLKQREGIVEIEVGIKGEWATSNLTSGTRYYSDIPGFETTTTAQTNSNDPFQSITNDTQNEINVVDIVSSSGVLQKMNDIDSSEVKDLKDTLIEAHSLQKKLEAIKEEIVNSEFNGADDDKMAELKSECEDVEGEFFDLVHNSDEFEKLLTTCFVDTTLFDSFIKEVEKLGPYLKEVEKEFPQIYTLIQCSGLIKTLELTNGLH